MTEQTYTYRDSTLNLGEAGNYTLLLQVNNTSFDYAIVNDKTLVALGTNCSIDELTAPNQLYDRLTAEYKNTIITLPAKAFTLVPAPLFDAARLPELARILDVKENEKVLAQALDVDNYVIYKVDEELITKITSYGTKSITFAPKGLIKAIEESSPSNTYLFLNLTDTQVEFIYFKRNKLRFYNKFDFGTPEDLIYFSIFVSEELELKQQSTTLILSGNINMGDALYKTLSEYFSNVRLNNMNLPDVPADIPAHQILSLLALCAL